MENNKVQNVDNDLLDLVIRLWRRRSLIIKWSIVGVVVGLVVAFSIPKRYKAGVIFAPETQQKTSSSISSIASMMGVNLNNSIDAISHEMYPDVLHSTPFIAELLDLEVSFKRNGETINTTLQDYMLEYQKSPWWSHIIAAPFKLLGWILSSDSSDQQDEDTVSDARNLTKDQRKVVKFFSKEIQILIDKKTGKTTVSLELQDPLVVAAVMDAVTENLKTYMSDYRTSKARQDIENLEQICNQRKEDYYKAQKVYAEYVDANRNVALMSAEADMEKLKQEMNLAYQVYSQVATQLEGSRIQAEQAKPVFVIIEPVSVPIKKSAPSKAKLLILYVFLSVCAASGWVLFGEEYWSRFKNNI